MGQYLCLRVRVRHHHSSGGLSRQSFLCHLVHTLVPALPHFLYHQVQPVDALVLLPHGLPQQHLLPDKLLLALQHLSLVISDCFLLDLRLGLPNVVLFNLGTLAQLQELAEFVVFLLETVYHR